MTGAPEKTGVTHPAHERTTSLDQRAQFLGLAFAGADLVFEIDGQGRILLALGAVEQITGVSQSALVGRNWESLVEVEDRNFLHELADSLGPGERRGPLQVALRRRGSASLKRYVLLSVFRVPQNPGRLSCAITVGAPARPPVPRDESGFIAPQSVDSVVSDLIQEAALAGHDVDLALVQLKGLQDALGGMAPDAVEAVRRQIASIFRFESYGGLGASRVAEDRFAILRRSGQGGGLIERLQAACGEAVSAEGVSLGLKGATAQQNLKAMRYALDRFIEADPAVVAAGFEDIYARTAAHALRLRTMLAADTFNLVYQPVVALNDRSLHHFEALARFGGDDSPADTIQLAEELGMIVDFDLAVAKMVAAKLLKGPPDLRIAINFSAKSLMAPQAIEALLGLSGPQGLHRRMLIEITETQRLADLEQANRIIRTLRERGHPVCIDDFGAGAATLEYLGRLEVEFVKIDGRYVREIEQRPRDGVVLRRLSQLCSDLGVSMIGEMVETDASAKILKDLGVQFAQGWLYGKPLSEPVWPPPQPSSLARRRGAIEQWG